MLITAYYYDHGYINVKLSKPLVSLSADKRYMYISIAVTEGERYRIGKLDFRGELIGTRDQHLGRLTVKSGEIFSRSKLGQDILRMTDWYKDQGYAYVDITLLTAIDSDARIVDLAFEVQKGQKVYFERINIRGNVKTRDKVIRRELRIYEGERFSGTGMRLSKQRVTALGFFETAEISTKRGSADDKVVATVEVKERPTGTFQIGAGFSSYENFILTGQISQQNFFGWGQTLSLQLQWSSVRQLGQIQFVEPYFLDTKFTFAFDLYLTEGIYTTFTRRSTGGSMTWGYELSGLQDWWPFARHLEDFRLFATYTNERVKVTESSLSTTARAAFSSGTTSSVRLSLQWDKRDNRIFPTNGFFVSASAELAPPFLAPEALFGKEVNLFTRYAIDLRYYHPVLWGVVFRTKLALGLINDWDAAHPVPISEFFYVGGINSVRGYRYLSISPNKFIAAVNDPGSYTTPFATGGDPAQARDAYLEAGVLTQAAEVQYVLAYVACVSLLGVCQLHDVAPYQATILMIAARSRGAMLVAPSTMRCCNTIAS